MEFTLEDVRIDPEKYCKQIPKYDSLLFHRFDLDIWSPEDYPIVSVDLGDDLIYFLSLLHPHSKMFRFSRRVYSTGNWVEISRIALLLEKIIVDSDTFFEIRFGDNESSVNLSFKLNTKNKEFSFGAIPLSDLAFVPIYFKFPIGITAKIVYDDVSNHERVSWVYFDWRLFKVGDQLMVYYSGMCGKVEGLCAWPKEFDERLKPAIGTRRRCMSFLAMLFFEEVGVSPEFIVAEF